MKPLMLLRHGLRSVLPPFVLLLGVLLVVTAGCRSTAPESPAAAPAAPAEEPPVYKNTIRWVTASELDNFGFDVYRSESEEGPFVRLNETTIPGHGTTDEENAYSFVDTTIDPHKAYYYYVESTALDGQREQMTPITRAPPKIAPEP